MNLICLITLSVMMRAAALLWRLVCIIRAVTYITKVITTAITKVITLCVLTLYKLSHNVYYEY